MRRMRDGSATEADLEGPPLILEDWGTVLEIHDRKEIAEIVQLIDDGVARGFTSDSTHVLGGALAFIYLEWKREETLIGYPVVWVWDDIFTVNQYRRDELKFRSRQLARKLASLARRAPMRTWWVSHPELQAPEVDPHWRRAKKQVDEGEAASRPPADTGAREDPDGV